MRGCRIQTALMFYFVNSDLSEVLRICLEYDRLRLVHCAVKNMPLIQRRIAGTRIEFGRFPDSDRLPPAAKTPSPSAKTDLG